MLFENVLETHKTHKTFDVSNVQYRPIGSTFGLKIKPHWINEGDQPSLEKKKKEKSSIS